MPGDSRQAALELRASPPPSPSDPEASDSGDDAGERWCRLSQGPASPPLAHRRRRSLTAAACSPPMVSSPTADAGAEPTHDEQAAEAEAEDLDALCWLHVLQALPDQESLLAARQWVLRPPVVGDVGPASFLPLPVRHTSPAPTHNSSTNAQAQQAAARAVRSCAAGALCAALGRGRRGCAAARRARLCRRARLLFCAVPRAAGAGQAGVQERQLL